MMSSCLRHGPRALVPSTRLPSLTTFPVISIFVDYNDKTGASLSGVKMYAFGETAESREIKNASAKVEQDATGRYIALFIYDNYPEDMESNRAVPAEERNPLPGAV